MIVLAMLNIDEGSVQVCEQSKAEILLVTTCLGRVVTTPTKRRRQLFVTCQDLIGNLLNKSLEGKR